MGKPLNCATWVMRNGVMLAALGISSIAAGQNLSDPTMPPAALRSAQEGNPLPAISGPVLQSVLVSPGRKVAIISGQTVNLGEKYDDARVINITESEVTLSGSNGVKTLKLFPGVEKGAATDRKYFQAEHRRQ